MTIKGKIHAKFDTQHVSDKFSKREFVIEYVENPMYPQYLLFQLVQKNCDKLDGFQAGQTVEVDFNLKGRSWVSPQNETKYFNSLEAWKITQVIVDVVAQPPVMPPAASHIPPNQPLPNSEDSLPF